PPAHHPQRQPAPPPHPRDPPRPPRVTPPPGPLGHRLVNQPSRQQTPHPPHPHITRHPPRRDHHAVTPPQYRHHRHRPTQHHLLTATRRWRRRGKPRTRTARLVQIARAQRHHPYRAGTPSHTRQPAPHRASSADTIGGLQQHARLLGQRRI